jgi:hypothetical protein
MRDLPSSGEDRVRSAKRRLVLDLFLRRDPFWSGVCDIRSRWNVSPVVGLPEPGVGGFPICYVPNSFGPRPPEPFGDEGERWSAQFRRWCSNLHTLHDLAVPIKARSTEYSAYDWEGFLSMCILFDPPGDKLEEFAEWLGWGPRGIGPRYAMHDPPIVHLRDPDKAEQAIKDFYEGFITAAFEKYVRPLGIAPEDAADLILKENPGLLDSWVRAETENRSRPFIEVKPHHTEQDVRSAFRLVSAKHATRPEGGRPNRDVLTTVQCAILADRHGWAYERIAEKYGWDPGSNIVGKYVEAGRRELQRCS